MSFLSYNLRYYDTALREFETLASQDRLMQYAGFEGGSFFARMCNDNELIERSNHEISEMLFYSITEEGKTRFE